MRVMVSPTLTLRSGQDGSQDQSPLESAVQEFVFTFPRLSSTEIKVAGLNSAEIVKRLELRISSSVLRFDKKE